MVYSPHKRFTPSGLILDHLVTPMADAAKVKACLQGVQTASLNILGRRLWIIHAFGEESTKPILQETVQRSNYLVNWDACGY